MGIVDPLLFAEGGSCAVAGDIGALSIEAAEALAASCCSSGTDEVFDVLATAQTVLGPEVAASFTAACLAVIAAAAGPVPEVAVLPTDDEGRLGIERDPTPVGGPSATPF